MTQTDAQAALAAAALVVANNGYAPSPLSAEQVTLQMADAFMAWLRGYGRATVVADERLVPNEDFRAPGQDATVVISPAADPVAPWRTASGEYIGPHVRGGPEIVTPSGAYACLCGEKWPCSQSEWKGGR